MIMTNCKMWGTLLLLTTVLSVVLGDNICGLNASPCTRTCNTGSCSCNLKCTASSWYPTCSNETCNLECSGRICRQLCKQMQPQNVCVMHCYAIQCAQTCDAATCHMTRAWLISFQNKIQCSGSGQCCISFMSLRNLPTVRGEGKCCTCKFSISQSSTLNAMTSTMATAIQVFATQSSAVQGTKNSLAYTPSQTLSPSPSFLSVLPSSSSLLSSWTSSSSSSSSSLSSSSSSSLSSSSSSSLSSSSSSSLSSTAGPPPSSPSPSRSSSSLTKTSPLSTLQIIKNMANDSVSKLNGIDIRRNSSLKEAVRVFEVFTDHLLNITKPRRGQQSNREDEKRRESIFEVAIAFEEFALNYGKHHLSQTKPSTKITTQKLVMGIQRGYRQNATDFFLKEEEWQSGINITSEDFSENGSVVVGCMYRDLHELLMRNKSIGDETGNSRYINTRIITAAMDPKPKQLQQDVMLKFRNLKVVDEKKHCMFWNGSKKSPDGFSEEGCHVDLFKSNFEQTVCSCNHLTHFAVLVDFSGSEKLTEKDVTVLEIITYLGLSLSIIGMLSTIILYSFFADVRQPLSQIRLSLAVSLGAGQIIFLAGINATENKAVCVTVAALMQYFLMAAFCWMLVEGIYLFLFVVKVYNINSKMHMYHVVSWGFPVVMVAISLSISAGKEGIQSYTSDKYCWMSSANSLIWIFVTFVITIEVVNILILARVIREITRMQPTGDRQTQQIRLGIRACAVMIPLLGVTWLFGLLSPLHKAFAYIFTILNSTQGFLIFSLHCVRNSQIKERFNRKVNTVFPSVNKGNSTKKSSQVNLSDVGDIRAVELESYH